ncbi:MAG TPA: hypothetical protein VG055_28385 [Planctomycetaceae bacterium]|jgi:hypothetical protein|nr:hypothetical protein [Planctomycetaceae bacterium]
MHVNTRRLITTIFVIALSTLLIRSALAVPGGRPGSPSSGTARQGTSNFRPQSAPIPGNNFARPIGPRFGTNPNQFNKTFPQSFSKNKNSPYWKKYGGWGVWYGPWHHGFGWGWGAWLNPWCVWPWYEVIPVADYANVYTDCAGVIVDGIDYSVPISRMPADTISGDDSDSYAAARRAFSQTDFGSALGAVAQAIGQMPHNRDMHQFHSLDLFAMNDYCRSATVAYDVLEDGPGWTWDKLQSFYPSADMYTNQLRLLERFVTAHPSDANVRFLLAYHYLMLDHADAARRQLTQVVELRPADKLAARILAGISEPQSASPVAASNGDRTTAPSQATSPVAASTGDRTIGPSQATVPQVSSPDNVSPKAAEGVSTPPITGTWKANPEKKVQIELALLDDGRFNWKFTANGRTKDFSGKFKLNNQDLTLTRDPDGDAMVGTVERTGGNGFRFLMRDAEAGDPGLDFTR